jgi:MFS family permease
MTRRNLDHVARAANGVLDRLVEPSARRNFLAFLGDFVAFGAGIAFVNPSTVLPALMRRLTDSTLLIGLVETIRNGVWLLPQLFAAWFLSGTVIRRKHMVLPFIVSRFALLLIVPTLLLLATGQPGTAVLFILVFLTLNIVFDACGSLPWYDLISHTLPPVGRTRLMGMGQFLSGGLGIGVGLAVAAILSTTRLRFPVNFAVLFAFASALFALEVYLVSRVRVTRAERSGVRVPLTQFLPRLVRIVQGDRRFRRLLLVRLLVGTSGFATPFYMICALDKLGLGAASVGIFTAAQVAGGIACAPLMALLAERRGITAMIRVASALGVALPLMALGMLAIGPGLVPDARLALFGLVFFVMGAMTNGVAAGFTNYLLDISPAENRPTYVGFANTFNGLILVMPLIGGWILGSFSWVALFCVTAAGACIGFAGSFGMVETRTPRATPGAHSLT